MIAGIRRTGKGLNLGTNNVPIVLAAGNVTAAGGNQSAAAELTYPVNNVTNNNGSLCTRLPAIRTPGQICYVYSALASDGLPIYPASGAAINGGSANAAVTIEGKTLAIFVATSETNWSAVYTAN